MGSIGLALTDTLDDLISEERIDPQLAMKILANFDQAITETLQKNVKSRLQFKVGIDAVTRGGRSDGSRGVSTRTGSATRSGHFSSRTSRSRWTAARRPSWRTRSRS